VDARGHDAGASMPGRGRAGDRVDELHDFAAVDVAIWVRIGGQHRPRHHCLRSCDGLGTRGHRAILSPASSIPRVTVLSREELRAALAATPPLIEDADTHQL